MELDENLRKDLLNAQRNEITEYHIYNKLARRHKQSGNAEILERIAHDEHRHYRFWREYTGKDVKPDKWKIFKFYWIARILGLTFSIKLMERGEENAQASYHRIANKIAEAQRIADEEDEHEHELINMIDEKRLNYVGSIVLGLNDALVELTGALAGLTFALQNTQIIALTGLITGIAASFSMAASEYLSKRSEGESEIALQSSLYTGTAYIVTVFLLILPFLLITNPFISLAITLGIALLIIFMFIYYVSIAKDYNFKARFLEMAGLSLGVAVISFFIGYAIRIFLGVDV
ncbi:MAG: VIT1/CCC1 transporter family protein [Bacteroidales bacterium]|nr:VIT1/CCC1 transporter family protein [Bacteroidales bacterium]